VPSAIEDLAVELVPRLPLLHEVRAAAVFQEDDELDEQQLVAWIERASSLPSEKM
jgi:hypothetical protein